MAIIIIGLLGLTAGAALGYVHIMTGLLITLTLLYRVVNLFRSIDNRIKEQRLTRTATTACLTLTLLSLAIILLDGLIAGLIYQFRVYLLVAGLSLLIAACALLLVTDGSLRRMRPGQYELSTPHRDLPTLTVAIPARNETDMLEECLRTLVRSTYPKLEIIVLDDCSQVKRTPEIIRQFAHDGVRFLSGEAAPESWLAKNYAYEQLSQAASGDIILFSGIDARFEPETLTKIVAYMIAEQRSMISIIPLNTLTESGLRSSLVQPFRYGWETTVPRNWYKNPPTISTCWAINKRELAEAGGFASVKQTIMPERYFARINQVQSSYRFIYSTEDIGMRTVKSLQGQIDTAIRVRYPQLHRSIENVLMVSFAELALALLPFILLLYSVVTLDTLMFATARLSIIILTMIYRRIIELTYRQKSYVAALSFPLALIYDVYLLNKSMYKYEFDEVIWKGRNICLPALQVYPGLPKLPDTYHHGHGRGHHRRHRHHRHHH